MDADAAVSAQVARALVIAAVAVVTAMDADAVVSAVSGPMVNALNAVSAPGLSVVSARHVRNAVRADALSVRGMRRAMVPMRQNRKGMPPSPIKPD